MLAFAVGTTNLLAYLEEITVNIDNTLVDARGVADRYAYNQVVKQGQSFDCKLQLAGVLAAKATSLDVTVWSLDGASYLGVVKSGSIDITNKAVERSAMTQAYKFPVTLDTDVSFTSDHMVVTGAALTYLAITGTQATLAGTILVTYAGIAFSAPMLIKSAKHSVKKGALQMENVTFALQGTPTGPTDSSLLALAMTGTALAAVTADTDMNSYAMNASQVCAITKLGIKFSDGQLTNQTATFEVQGQMAATANG